MFLGWSPSSYLEETGTIEAPAADCRHLAPVGPVTREGHTHVHHLKEQGGMGAKEVEVIKEDYKAHKVGKDMKAKVVCCMNEADFSCLTF